jgi:hypothetical protein
MLSPQDAYTCCPNSWHRVPDVEDRVKLIRKSRDKYTKTAEFEKRLNSTRSLSKEQDKLRHELEMSRLVSRSFIVEEEARGSDSRIPA